MDVSVSIVNWNRVDLLEHCLHSIFATSRTIEYEVIVVDNASQDESVQLVRMQFPRVRLIINAENRGFGSAHNQALAYATGRYFLALNSDATVQPETIPTLMRIMDKRPEVGISGCPAYRLSFPSMPTGRGYLRYPIVSGELRRNLWELCRPVFGTEWPVDPPIRTTSTEVAWITGALLLLRREMLDKIGGFDEQFFLFFEDVDLCRRARVAGWGVLYTQETAFSHAQGASREVRSDIERIFGESGAAYFRKHHGWLAGQIFRLQHVLIRRWLLQWRCQIGRVVRNWTIRRTKGKTDSEGTLRQLRP